MKIKLPFILFILPAIIYAQGTWTQKANFGGTARRYAVGFSIGTKAYIGTGDDGMNRQDFWEYDQLLNTWSQIANFPGTPRQSAISFSIGTRGYVGTGNDGTDQQDFWEWDQTNNKWTQKTNFSGVVRAEAVAFSIGLNGYIGTGHILVGTNFSKDFWEYNASTDAWTQKADFVGINRCDAVGFSIGAKGYIGLGGDTSNVPFKDFWEWDQANNTWTQKADFSGAPRWYAVGFSIGLKGYIGTGSDATKNYKDFWEYDPGDNTWSQKADFGGAARTRATGFSIGTKGYLGTGEGSVRYRDFWEFNPLQSSMLISSPCINQCNGSVSVSVSGGVSPYSYSWNTSPVQTTITATGLCDTLYTLMVTDSLGYTLNKSVFINSLSPPPSDPICLITVDTSLNKNKIVWEQLSAPQVVSYNIYRETSNVGIYTLIGNSSIVSPNVFIDTLSNPTQKSSRYKITAIDTCANESYQSSSHKTIHLSVYPGFPPAINLSWDDYEGFNFGTYYIWRGNSNGALILIDSVQNTINTYTDANTPSGTLCYAIEINRLQVCSPFSASPISSSFSNVVCNNVNGINEYNLSNFISILPNPTNGKFQVQIMRGDERKYSLEISNTLGEKVFQSSFFQKQYQIDISLELNGFYFLKITAQDGNSAVKKIIKERF